MRITTIITRIIWLFRKFVDNLTQADEVALQKRVKVSIDSMLKLPIKHNQVFGALLQIQHLQLCHNEIQVIDCEYQRHFERLLMLLALTKVLLR